MPNPNLPVADGDVVSVRVYCYDQEQLSVNGLGYTVSGSAGGGIRLLAIAQAIDNNLATPYKALLNNQATYLGVDARKYIGQSLSLSQSTKANTGAGGAGADALPRQTCGMFTKVTGTAGPKGRGRMYVPFPAQADNGATPIPTAGYMTNLGTLAGAVLQILLVTDGVGTATVTPCLIRAPRPHATPTPVLLGTTPLLTATARQAWATHRSRGSFGRPNPLPF